MPAGQQPSSWAIYHHVALRQSYHDVVLSLNDLFGFSFQHGFLKRDQPLMAAKYTGHLRSAEGQTPARAIDPRRRNQGRGQEPAGYVWAFTNLEEVVYVYTPTREGTILEEMLKGFTGVLVSDFYTAYDALKCPQQKCLIHLMRDINDDVFHSPFDEDLKQLAQKLVGLLKPIIDTIDTFGLTSGISTSTRRTWTVSSASWRPRCTNRNWPGSTRSAWTSTDKLFVFLDYDGVPWNNNNAENAIKLFASRRRMMGPRPPKRDFGTTWSSSASTRRAGARTSASSDSSVLEIWTSTPLRPRPAVDRSSRGPATEWRDEGRATTSAVMWRETRELPNANEEQWAKSP